MARILVCETKATLKNGEHVIVEVFRFEAAGRRASSAGNSMHATSERPKLGSS